MSPWGLCPGASWAIQGMRTCSAQDSTAKNPTWRAWRGTWASPALLQGAHTEHQEPTVYEELGLMEWADEEQVLTIQHK